MTTQPAKTLGIVGGGQLGRMSALAAQKLGITVHIYSPEDQGPAAQVADKHYTGQYSALEKVRDFARSVDVVSYEFENIPLETVRAIQEITPVYPDTKLLEVAQDRVTEKSFLNNIGIPTAKWAEANDPDELQMLANDLGCSEYVLKTTRFGYDGKGQIMCSANEDSKAKWHSLNSEHIIMEQKIDFKCEISVIVARDQFGGIEIYDPSLNEHKNHILDRSIVPAPLDHDILDRAMDLGRTLAEKVNLVGILALELFVTNSGELLANEIAPRTHNSGHWTMDACEVSQFENHVRTVCGLPVGSAARHSEAEMINLIGDDIDNLTEFKNNPNATIHLYGKAETRAGRKMGHVNIIKETGN